MRQIYVVDCVLWKLTLRQFGMQDVRGEKTGGESGIGQRGDRAVSQA